MNCQIPQCERVKKDGVRCGSPALHGKSLCYFHSRAPRPKPKRVVPQVPDPGNALAVLNWTLRGLMSRTLDPKEAAQIIYGIQQMHLEPLWRRERNERSEQAGDGRRNPERSEGSGAAFFDNPR